MTRPGLALVLVVLGAAGVSCKLFKRPAAGDPCSQEGQVQCNSPKSALLCRGGTQVAVSCGGAGGCTSGDPVLCDDDLATAGDACIEPSGRTNMACTSDLASLLVCKGGTFTLGTPCRGKDGCKASSSVKRSGGSTSISTDVLCDDTLAAPADPCVTADHTACSLDAKMTLTCKGGAMVPALGCRGPKGCVIKPGDKPDEYGWDCDDSLGESGDPCKEEGRHVCNTDGSMWLVCKSGTMRPDNSCRGARGCVTTDDPAHPGTMHVTCDDSLALAGDPCEPDGEYACTVDGKSLLLCKDAKYVTSKPCARGCTVTSEEGGHRLRCD